MERVKERDETQWLKRIQNLICQNETDEKRNHEKKGRRRVGLVTVTVRRMRVRKGET